MDNRHIDIMSEGKKALEHSLALIWENCPGGKATHYLISNIAVNPKGIPTLIFFWHEDKGVEKLPFPITFDKATDFVSGWLDTADYGPQPDHDGSNHKGFRIFNEDWGHVMNSPYGFCAVQPVWAMYGK